LFPDSVRIPASSGLRFPSKQIWRRAGTFLCKCWISKRSNLWKY